MHSPRHSPLAVTQSSTCPVRAKLTALIQRVNRAITTSWRADETALDQCMCCNYADESICDMNNFEPEEKIVSVQNILTFSLGGSIKYPKSDYKL